MHTGSRLRRALAATLTAITALTLAQEPAGAAPIVEPIGPQFVIGPDTRYPVDPAANPAAATVLLTFVYYDGGEWKPARCTGWVSGYHAGSTTIITAGHCVFWQPTGIWHRNYHVHAGSISCPAVALYKPAGLGPGPFVPEHDYGAAKVDCRPSGQPLGQLTGAYGYSTGNLAPPGTAVRTQGYPNDKQSSPWPQWGANGVTGPSTAQRLFYDNDTTAGQDGSPVYRPNHPGCGHCVVAIHGGYADPVNNLNNGVRISTEVYQNIHFWTNVL